MIHSFRRYVTSLASCAALVLAPHISSAQSPTLKVFTTRAIRTVLDSLGPQFESTSGHRLDVIVDIAAPLVRRVRSGEPFDVLVASPDQLNALVGDGYIVPASRIDLARSGIGVAVREGAATPDVSSLNAFRRTLLNASSIAFLSEGQSGVYLAGVLDDLGIMPGIQHKVVRPVQDVVAQLVAEGSVEIGLVVVTQILTTPGVTLAGPLPLEIQNYIAFSAGISSRSSATAAATELLNLLSSPAAHSVMRSQGMEPMLGFKP